MLRPELLGVAQPVNVTGSLRRGILDAQQDQAFNQAQEQGELQNQILQQNVDSGALKKDLTESQLVSQNLKNQEMYNSLGVPDKATAQMLAINSAKVAALPTTAQKIAELGRMKQAAINAGRTTNNIDELLQEYNKSESAGNELLNAGVRAFEQVGLLTPQQKLDIDQQSLNVRKQEVALKEKAEARQSAKLSAGLEKSLIAAQDDATSAQRNATEFDILADQVESMELSGGVVSTTTETLKRLLGTQDDVTEMRRRFNSVRLSQGLKNLPPGPATDKDMAEAFKGVPAENAPASQIASFLRGAAKMARFDAGYNQFKADYISDNETAKGLNREWRKSVNSSVLDRSVTIAEIYAEASAEGLTIEEVKKELGIE